MRVSLMVVNINIGVFHGIASLMLQELEIDKSYRVDCG